MGGWYFGLEQAGGIIGLKPLEGAGELGTVYFFFTPDMLWFYIYYVAAVLLFALFWFRFSPASLAELVDPRFGLHPFRSPFRCRRASPSTTGAAASSIWFSRR